jgi:hypothetical protein
VPDEEPELDPPPPLEDGAGALPELPGEPCCGAGADGSCGTEGKGAEGAGTWGKGAGTDGAGSWGTGTDGTDGTGTGSVGVGTGTGTGTEGNCANATCAVPATPMAAATANTQARLFIDVPAASVPPANAPPNGATIVFPKVQDRAW